MPKIVDHRERRETIAHQLWTIIDQRGWSKATMREVARAAGVSLGQLQHYFSSRDEMLAFAVEFAAERTAQRITRATAALEQPPRPKEVLRVILIETLPLHDDARVTSRVHAAYVLEALHDPALRQKVATGLRQGRDMIKDLLQEAQDSERIRPNRDVELETDRALALTGFAPLLELGVLEPRAALAAVDRHLDELFES